MTDALGDSGGDVVTEDEEGWEERRSSRGDDGSLVEAVSPRSVNDDHLEGTIRKYLAMASLKRCL